MRNPLRETGLAGWGGRIRTSAWRNREDSIKGSVTDGDLTEEQPLYSLANDSLLEYGDLVCFAPLAVTAIKFIRGLARPPTKKKAAYFGHDATCTTD
jgi:hypothetical protein